ncbi:MAG: tRNA (adenosine(37)-N6)-threonylcarbamoyltransferase complex ATPase subunit type 1 TsaE [Candidatus Omnitrophica bacterium]|nr:tRNA (adenosine(37)-N6)-threonylcarbamoyltransferase complex ATPase subunit type 1 TsaE [Candidatus Omnitrophota bacterium]
MIKSKKFISHSVADTLSIGKSLSGYLRKADIICLSGQLGAGKTVFTKGVALGLGIKRDKIISPTFVLIREHKGKMPLYHFDFYRLSETCDIAGLGYEEYLYGDGISVIEWPDRLGNLMPEEFLCVELSVVDEKKRAVTFIPHGKRYRDLLEALDENFSV